jgi:hypothetical protein
MQQMGGECANLAAVGYALLDSNKIRIFPTTDSTNIGGAAPLGGGSTGPNAWMVLNETWTDIHHDYSNRTNEQNGPRTLQHVLAHEADHLLNRTHINIPGTQEENLYETPNSRACMEIS